MLPYQILTTVVLLAFFFLTLRNLYDYQRPASTPATSNDTKGVFLLIPARNERENIEACVTSLLAQTFSNFTLVVLDDNSDDGTGEILAGLAAKDSRIQLIQGKPIPSGWAGKVWACSQLGEFALQQNAEWLLFLDADTRAEPELLVSLLDHANQHKAGMVSGFPYQITGSFWERVVLPNLHFLITTFLPIGLIWRLPNPNLVAACGQVEFFSSETYKAVGGHASIPQSFHDGLQLARRVKAVGKTVRLLDTSKLITCRMYRGGSQVWNGFTRNAYEGLGSLGALITMTTLQVWLFLLPFVFLLVWIGMGVTVGTWQVWGWLCVAQVALILIQRTLQASRFGHPESVVLHPLSMFALVAIQWGSFWKSKRKSKITWKGRTYG